MIYNWNPPAAGGGTRLWNDANDWLSFGGGPSDPLFPNGANAVANFSTGPASGDPPAPIGAMTVTTQSNPASLTVNQLNFNGSTAYTISFQAGSRLRFDTTGSLSTPVLSMASGTVNQTIATPVDIIASLLTVNQNSVAGSLTISQGVAGSGALTKSGAGTVVFAGANTYSGTTTVSQGTLQVGNGGTTGALSNTSNGVNNAAVVFDRSNDSTYTNVISGTGSVTEQGAGSLTLTNDHTYSGTTTVSGGTLKIGTGGSTGSITGNLVANAAVEFNRSAASTYGGAITGSGTIAKLGGGEMTLSGDGSAFAGATTISGGTLQIGNGGLTGSLGGAIVNNAALKINRSDAYAHTGAISGSGTVTKLGGGSTTLTGAMTYTGATTVSEGTLVFGASSQPTSSSRLSVDSGATLNLAAEAYSVGSGGAQVLEGTGTVQTGAAGSGLTIGTNGTIAPRALGGSHEGTLTVVGDTTFAGGGTYEVTFNKQIGPFSAGVDNDFISSSGALAVTATPGNKFTIRLIYTGGSGPGPATPETITVATFANSITGFSTDAFEVVGDFDPSFTPMVTTDGQSIFVTFDPVPEPASVLAVAALGLAGAGYARRRLTRSR